MDPRSARDRDLRLVVGSVGLSALGDFLAFVPLALQLESTTGSPHAVSALLVALWGPIVILAPIAGLLVDRVETRRLLIVVSLAQAVVAAALAAGPGVTLILAGAIPIVAAILGLLVNRRRAPADDPDRIEVGGRERIAAALAAAE